jgi:hypothetical protein
VTVQKDGRVKYVTLMLMNVSEEFAKTERLVKITLEVMNVIVWMDGQEMNAILILMNV